MPVTFLRVGALLLHLSMLGPWQTMNGCTRHVVQVRSLLSLFVDIETTDRSNAFYEKFNTRYKAGQILGVCPCIKPFSRPTPQ